MNEVHNMIQQVCNDYASFLIAKNKAYGSSFSDPINIFSKTSAEEQLYVRIDDKLNRLSKGQEYPGDDTVKDLIGYLILLEVLRRLPVDGAIEKGYN